MFAFVAFASCYLTLPHEEKSFVAWMRSTNNVFTGDEYHFRLGVFMTTLRYIEDFNRDKSKTYRLGLNHLSALTRTEYLSMLGTRPCKTNGGSVATGRRVAPEQIDWREKGVVNEIKDQGQCGSCWAFGTVQASESAYAIKYGQLLSLSESNLVDCCPSCQGCDGGVVRFAIEWIRDSQGGKLNTEEDYPYAPIATDCKFDASKAVGSVKGYIRNVENSEEDLKEKIGTLGPASVNINAHPADFHSYSEGIYNNPECWPLAIDHSVGCVGYGSEKNTAYWILRNSWGEVWGEKGYMRLARNAGNLCSVATEAYFVTA